MCHWCRRAGLNGCFCGEARPQAKEPMDPRRAVCRACGITAQRHNDYDCRGEFWGWFKDDE